MHGLEKVNFSNNLIGKRPRVSMETSGGNEPEGSSPAVVTPDQSSHALVDVYTEGIEVRALVDVYTEGIEVRAARDVEVYPSWCESVVLILKCC